MYYTAIVLTELIRLNVHCSGYNFYSTVSM